MTSTTTTTKPARVKVLWNILRRVATICLIAFCIGWILNELEARTNATNQPAGFGHGALHGALMPLAMPNLLVGHDVTIYARNNTGRTYKLGYTVGVNACGALFFGVTFFRLSRWRSRNQGRTVTLPVSGEAGRRVGG